LSRTAHEAPIRTRPLPVEQFVPNCAPSRLPRSPEMIMCHVLAPQPGGGVAPPTPPSSRMSRSFPALGHADGAAWPPCGANPHFGSDAP